MPSVNPVLSPIPPVVARGPPVETAEIESLRALERQQAAVLAFARRTNAQPQLSVLLQDAVALIAESLQVTRSGVAEMSGESLLMKVFGMDDDGSFGRSLTSEVPMKPKESIVAYALHTAHPVASPELSKEERFNDKLLKGLGITSALVVPLHVCRRPYGALAVFSDTLRNFTTNDVSFSETIANLLTSSIARVEAESRLAEREAVMSSVLDAVESPLIQLDRAQKIIEVNAACQRVSGFVSSEVKAKPFVSVFAIPEDVDGLHDCFRDSMRSRSAKAFAGFLLTKGNQRREVHWHIVPHFDANGEIARIFVSVDDRTEVSQLQAKLEATQKRVERAMTVIEQLKRESEAAVPRERLPEPPQPAKSPKEDDESRQGDDRPFSKVKTESASETRNSPRRAFNYRQLIAPVHDKAMPSRNKFFQVACEDISAGGISFLMDGKPEFKDVVVALGRPPMLTFFTAEIVRISEKEIDGERAYLVGCRFTGRVSL